VTVRHVKGDVPLAYFSVTFTVLIARKEFLGLDLSLFLLLYHKFDLMRLAGVSKMDELKGKVAIVTGAGRGICKAIAMKLASEGCRVAIASNVQSEIDGTASEIKTIGAGVLSMCLDLGKKENNKKLVKATIDRFGMIDILINGAGVLFQRPFLEHSVEDWDKTFEINLRSYFILTKLVLDIMRERRDGYIINISSTGVQWPRGDLAAYIVSKYGVQGLSRATCEASLRYNFGIKVSTVFPGATDTAMARSIDYGHEIKNWLLPEDIADVVISLLKTNKRVIIKDLIVDINFLN